LDSNTKMTLVD